MSLQTDQALFFKALGEEGKDPQGVRGLFEIYRYAYFERIRASIEEDYPLVFEYLETVVGRTDGLDSAKLTREILSRRHPSSWSLGEASLPVPDTLRALLDQPNLSDLRTEVLRLAELDTAETLASWLEDWPDPSGKGEDRVERFARGELSIVRTKTWKVADRKVFWRSDSGVQSADLDRLQKFSGLFGLVAEPISFASFSERSVHSSDEELIGEFMRLGMAEGWLRFV